MGTMEIIVSIAGILLGGTSIYTIIENIKYRKENKNLKTLEVEKASLETQEQQIDLATKYKENTMKMLDELQKTYDAILKNGDDNSTILRKIDEINHRIDETNNRIDVLTSEVKEVKEEQKIQKIYLNGEYAAFRKIYLEMQAKDDNKKKKPASKKKKEDKPQDNNSKKQE